ncbi:hypothetical protein [Paracoccus ravus]|uniref:hypothetical protein n=1 Tax=Paracoccus ravus TaxID=2447760 RepID=UPI00106EE78B|nr:hypothetical protein [Paracoccus ravus]
MTRPLRIWPWLVLGLAAGVLVLAEPALRQVLPRQIWIALGLGEAPLRFLPLALTGLIAAGLGLHVLRAMPDFATGALAALLAAAQVNGVGAGPLDLFDLALGLVFLGWIARFALDADRPLRLSFLFFVTGGFLLLALAHLPVMSPVKWLVGLVGVIRISLISLLIVDMLRSRAVIDNTLFALVVVAACSAAVGVVQFGLAYFGLYYFTLIDPPVTAFKPTPIGFVMRASGFCETAQHYSSFLLYALPAALWRLSDRMRLGDLLVCLLLLAGITVAFNFAAIFGAALILTLFPLLRWPDRAIQIVLFGMALLVTAYYAGLAELIHDVTFGDSGVAKGVDQRRMLFQLGLEQVARNPWFGTGLGGFGAVDGNFWDRPVHNIFGQSAAELGILGFLLILSVFLVLPLDLGAVLMRGSPDRAAAAQSLMMVLGGLVASQAEPNLQQSNLWLVLALAQAVILTAARSQDHGRQPQQPQ